MTVHIQVLHKLCDMMPVMMVSCYPVQPLAPRAVWRSRQRRTAPAAWAACGGTSLQTAQNRFVSLEPTDSKIHAEVADMHGRLCCTVCVLRAI